MLSTSRRIFGPALALLMVAGRLLADNAEGELTQSKLADEVAEDTLDPVAALRQPLTDALGNHGVALELSYSADFFTNARGGLNTTSAFQFRGLLDFSLTLETEPLGLWNGGAFFVNFIENHGVDITERYVGDLQAVNNADAPNEARVYEAWYEQLLFDGRLRVKAGKLDVNGDFAAGLYRDEFIHSSPGFSPTIPMITWPDTAWGVALFIEPTEWLYLGAGVYDALGASKRFGLDTALHTPDESFTIFELGLRPRLALFGQSGLPGQYAIGGVYHSGVWPIFLDDLGGRLPARFETGNASVYVTLDQMLFREEGTEDSKQGLGAFFQFAWAPSDRNEITQHYGGGFQYYGPLPTRDDDVCGVGVHHVNLSHKVQALEQRYSETAIEVFYKAQVTEWMSIKPDVQYVVNPGGAGRDALVAGVRLEFGF